MAFVRASDVDDWLRRLVFVVWLAAGIVSAFAAWQIPADTARIASRLDAEYRATLAADRARLQAEFGCSQEPQP